MNFHMWLCKLCIFNPYIFVISIPFKPDMWKWIGEWYHHDLPASQSSLYTPQHRHKKYISPQEQSRSHVIKNTMSILVTYTIHVIVVTGLNEEICICDVNLFQTIFYASWEALNITTLTNLCHCDIKLAFPTCNLSINSFLVVTQHPVYLLQALTWIFFQWQFLQVPSQ